MALTEPYIITTLKGVVEALTEFLPVSSTGHLFLMNFGMHFPNTPQFLAPKDSKVSFSDMFDIVVQFGAIFAVIVEYRRSLWQRLALALRKDAPPPEPIDATAPTVEVPTAKIVMPEAAPAPATPAEARAFWWSIILGTIPVLIVGYAFKGWLDGIESNPQILLILASAWLVGGIVMWVNELFVPKETVPTAWHIDTKTSIVIGLLQCVAMWPGISRSAVTIITGRRLGLSKQAAAEYSFFLAVPALTAASAYKLLKSREMLLQHPENLVILGIGTLIAFMGAWLVIRAFLAFLRKFTFVPFAAYRVVLGLIVFGLYFGGWRTPSGVTPETPNAPIAPIATSATSAPSAPAAVEKAAAAQQPLATRRALENAASSAQTTRMGRETTTVESAEGAPSVRAAFNPALRSAVAIATARRSAAGAPAPRPLPAAPNTPADGRDPTAGAATGAARPKATASASGRAVPGRARAAGFPAPVPPSPFAASAA
ncbi:MAG: undecaprenyl-diphosphate phosphatase [Planctomycetota bacterium]